MAYLTQVKAGGKQYIYLTEYVGNQEYTTKNERNIYGFGSSGMALLRMKRWLWKFDREFPQELKDLGFGVEDLKEWINTLETGVTKKGRKFNYKKENVEFYNIYNIY